METCGRKYDALYDDIEGAYEYQDGLLCLPCMPKKLMNDLMNEFEFEKDDVVIISYPMSGFFWLQEVVWRMHNMDKWEGPEAKEPLAFRIPFLEHEFRNIEPLTLLKKYPAPRLMKSHLSYDFLKKQMHKNLDNIRIIIWTMNPKDVVVSYQNFWNTKGKLFDFPELEWNKFFELFQDKQLFEGDWFDQMKSWLPMLNRENVLLLQYEEARIDPEGTVKQIAKFLGRKVSGWKAQQIAHSVEFDECPNWKKKYTEQQAAIVNNMYKTKMAGTSMEGVYVD